MTFRDIPSIEQLRQRQGIRPLEDRFGHAMVVEALRAVANGMRERMAKGDDQRTWRLPLRKPLIRHLHTEHASSLRSVINATGVIVHTNLGRAPLSRAAVERVATLAQGYTNLEYDLAAGRRGKRDVHAERLICRLTGAQAAVVVNNNAAATLLGLAAVAAGREVIISRGELVEIGGGFRVPDVMAQSGAVLREVGTTNRTRAADYAAAIGDRTAAILRVHPSNFRVEGFTERPSLDELVELGRRFGVAVLEDLGSGFLDVPGSLESLGDEPPVRSSIASGADLVMFSGDKLLGGPQAGILAGSIGHRRAGAEAPADARAARRQDDLRRSRSHAGSLCVGKGCRNGAGDANDRDDRGCDWRTRTRRLPALSKPPGSMRTCGMAFRRLEAAARQARSCPRES